jgi:hypothetical protein
VRDARRMSTAATRGAKLLAQMITERWHTLAFVVDRRRVSTVSTRGAEISAHLISVVLLVVSNLRNLWGPALVHHLKIVVNGHMLTTYVPGHESQ